MEHCTALRTLHGLAGLMLAPSSSSPSALGTKMRTEDPSQALTPILRQVPQHCCSQASTYNSNTALFSKFAPSAYSESELLISVTRDLFLSPISLAELTQLRTSEWDANFGSHLTASGERFLEQPLSTGKQMPSPWPYPPLPP